MQREDQGPEVEATTGNESSEMVTDGAVNANTELRKRRSTRIVQAVPLNVTGVDALGRPFTERTSTLIINCHGCRYQSKHYVLKNMWVNLEVPHPEPGHAPRRVRGKVAWIQRPRTVRQLFQVALELEASGNVWGIAFPPEDWFGFSEGSEPGTELSEPANPLLMSTGGELPSTPHPEGEAAAGAPDNLRVFPAPASATDASLQLARQVARLLSEAKQQIQTAVRESAVQAVAAERRVAFEQWDQKYTAFREEVARETAHAVDKIQEETIARVRSAQDTAAETLKTELPRWLAPQLEQLTHELTAQLAREGAEQREQQEKQIASAHEALQTLCAQAEEAAAKLRTQAEVVESQVSARVVEAAKAAEEEHRKRQELAATQGESLSAGWKELEARMGGTLSGAEQAFREQIGQAKEEARRNLAAEIERTNNETRSRLHEELEQHKEAARNEITAESQRQHEALRGSLDERMRQLEELMARTREATERLEQFGGRIESAQQQAIGGFQSQLDDVLSLHRNELHRQSDQIFEEIHRRIQSSFESANSQALEKFEQQVQSMVEPHVRQTEEAIHRLAGGRSLLDAAMTMQQDRIRTSADEAFAESLARFRENLGSVEQVLNESAQAITARNLDELETKTIDLKHQTMEEMFKSAEWYEKKAQTQLQTQSERLAEQSVAQLREKAGEVSGLFATELNHASRSYLAQAQHQMDESVRDAFERVRMLFAEAADTTSAAFTDEIQRNARQELEGFNELMGRSLEESREKFDAAREATSMKLTGEQEAFLRKFQQSMGAEIEKGLNEAKAQVETRFAALAEAWRTAGEAKAAEIRGNFGKLSDESAVNYRDRLENISNSWMVATVATLDHQSRDVIAKIAAAAEEQLRHASSEVFARFGDTLRERLQQIAQGFDAGSTPKS